MRFGGFWVANVYRAELEPFTPGLSAACAASPRCERSFRSAPREAPAPTPSHAPWASCAAAAMSGLRRFGVRAVSSVRFGGQQFSE